MGPRRVGPRREGRGRTQTHEPPKGGFFLSSLSWGSSRGILVVFEAPGPSNVHVAFKNITKIPLEDPQERDERMHIVAGEGKNVKFWVVQERGPGKGGPKTLKH